MGWLVGARSVGWPREVTNIKLYQSKFPFPTGFFAMVILFFSNRREAFSVQRDETDKERDGDEPLADVLVGFVGRGDG
jgi:hypothetical protein